MTEISVIGAGVIGLTTAVRLLEEGHRVEVLHDRDPQQTTSAVAAAIWYPYLVRPRDRVLPWAMTSLRRFESLAADDRTGVRLIDGLECLAGETPWWHGTGAPGTVDHAREGDPPSAGRLLRARLPVARMPDYLDYLVRSIEERGGCLDRRRVNGWDEIAGEVLINCAGLGARELCDDFSLVGVRGQVLRVEGGTCDRWVIDDRDPQRPTYIVPRGADTILGGSAEKGAEEIVVDPELSARIRERAIRLAPGLEGAAVLGTDAGIRPSRPAVRLEADRDGSGRLLIHNYGHGGSGMTLSWGCAEEVAKRTAAGLAGA